MLLQRVRAKFWPEQVIHALRQAYACSENDLVVSIKEDNASRSIKQNRLLWTWHNFLVKHIEEYQGTIFDKDDIHEYVVDKLLPRRAVGINGDVIIVRTSTRKLSTKEFADFLDRYDSWAAQTYQCFFPRPDDLYWAALMKESE